MVHYYFLFHFSHRQKQQQQPQQQHFDNAAFAPAPERNLPPQDANPPVYDDIASHSFYHTIRSCHDPSVPNDYINPHACVNAPCSIDDVHYETPISQNPNTKDKSLPGYTTLVKSQAQR